MRVSLRASLPRRPKTPKLSRATINNLNDQFDRDCREEESPFYVILSDDYSIRVDLVQDNRYDCKVVWYLDENSDAVQILGLFRAASFSQILDRTFEILKGK